MSHPPYPSLGTYSRLYRKMLERYLTFFIPKKSSVLDVGCGVGFFSKSFDASSYTGVDLLEDQIQEARDADPEATYICGDIDELTFDQTYDILLLSDVLNGLNDVQNTLTHLHQAATPKTRMVINIHNTLWRPILALGVKLGLIPPTPKLNWLSKDDVQNLLDLAGWEVLRQDTRILCPFPLFGLGTVVNKILAPFLPWFCLSILIVARPKPCLVSNKEKPSVTVIVPARNEAGNLEAAITRTPKMGRHMELIFVEGNSQDNTWE